MSGHTSVASCRRQHKDVFKFRAGFQLQKSSGTIWTAGGVLLELADASCSHSRRSLFRACLYGAGDVSCLQAHWVYCWIQGVGTVSIGCCLARLAGGLESMTMAVPDRKVSPAGGLRM